MLGDSLLLWCEITCWNIKFRLIDWRGILKMTFVDCLDLAAELLHNLLQLQDGQMSEHPMLDEFANLTKKASQSDDLCTLTVTFPSHSVPTIGQGAPEQYGHRML